MRSKSSDITRRGGAKSVAPGGRGGEGVKIGFIANKITLKCINKNGKIICFAFTSSFFSPPPPPLVEVRGIPSAFSHPRTLPSTLTAARRRRRILPASILCVIVKVNILRISRWIFLSPNAPARRQREKKVFLSNFTAKAVSGAHKSSSLFPPSHASSSYTSVHLILFLFPQNIFRQGEGSSEEKK